MNKTAYIILAAAVILLGGAALTDRGSAEPTERLTYTQVRSEVEDGAVFYDVRTPEEYASGHFAATENWSLQQMEAGQLPEVEKNTKIYLHCQSGNRSAQAAKILREAGYTQVIDLGGVGDVKGMGGTFVS